MDRRGRKVERKPAAKPVPKRKAGPEREAGQKRDHGRKRTMDFDYIQEKENDLERPSGPLTVPEEDGDFTEREIDPLPEESVREESGRARFGRKSRVPGNIDLLILRSSVVRELPRNILEKDISLERFRGFLLYRSRARKVVEFLLRCEKLQEFWKNKSWDDREIYLWPSQEDFVTEMNTTLAEKIDEPGLSHIKSLGLGIEKWNWRGDVGSLLDIFITGGPEYLLQEEETVWKRLLSVDMPYNSTITEELHNELIKAGYVRPCDALDSLLELGGFPELQDFLKNIAVHLKKKLDEIKKRLRKSDEKRNKKRRKKREWRESNYDRPIIKSYVQGRSSDLEQWDILYQCSRKRKEDTFFFAVIMSVVKKLTKDPKKWENFDADFIAKEVCKQKVVDRKSIRNWIAKQEKKNGESRDHT